jgi:squalene-hopene/tetraprenyl-beta-curcumene cyclase
MRKVLNVLFLSLALTPWALAQDLQKPQVDHPNLDGDHEEKAARLIRKGAEFLLSKQLDAGGWTLMGNEADPAITGLVVRGLLAHPNVDARHPAIQKGIEKMLAFQQEDGGIYNPRVGRQNYTTAVAIMALVATGDPQYKDAIDRAVAYIKSIQIVPGSESPDGSKITKGHPFIGGTSYGRHGRPDLSNLGFSAEALHAAGVKPDDPFFKNALKFVQRTQNLREGTNDRPWVKLGTGDGGFIYAPAIASDLSEPESKAGGVRSYGSMTYTGFKTLLYAGVDRQDKRVIGAYNWIRRYWRLDSNPNMPQAQSKEGLYYYYHVFAKALSAYGEAEIPVLKDGKTVERNWREDLLDALSERMSQDGAWRNDTKRWYEDDPVLCTSYVMMALGEVIAK